MSETELLPESEPPTPPVPPPGQPVPPVRPFNDAVTVGFTLVLLFGVITTIVGSLEGTRYFESFRQPLAVTAQFFDRELEIAEVPPPTAAWAQPLKPLLISPMPEVHELVIRAFEQALEAHLRGTIGGPPEEVRLVEGRLALVLGEAGRSKPLEGRLHSLAAMGQEEARLARVIRYAYGFSDEPLSREQLEEVLPLLNDPARPKHTWATDRLEQRTLRRLGDQEGARNAEARILERGSRAFTHDLALYGTMMGVVLVGLLLGVLRLLLRRPLPRVASGFSPAPWTGSEGYAMAVRAVVFSQAGFFCIPDVSPASMLLGFLLGWVPMLYYLTQRVPKAYGVQPSGLFGLRLEAPVTSLLLVTLVLVSLEQAFAMGVGIAGRSLEMERWYEGMMEDLMRGSPAEVAGLVIMAVIGAPLFEELAFRGILYTSLRTRLGPWLSAVVSAALFTLLHVYSPIGMLMLFTGAVVSALVYERTRSLLPCIIAHAMNNLLVAGTSLLVYRGA
ncbi:CPBP family intramembrane glutamic endopeptidase [Hyalangium rubrum]|uniref:CPBP family intramembrane glutamic endopeptidase n=1 Tax=Hyalangium rubrum TaxID=3103134 RepID=A0ABU5HH13_9BACT|nr:CPBP family intramembrane glutamic endopeptidase [Hyalangium sp. s54d21]MDY7232122.1 CPBP family intramembrane glutamic endopeptidase [Hyalangium sp. s54d21]